MGDFFKELSGDRLPSEVMKGIAVRAKVLRRSRKISQAEMAQRSGVSLGSLKRFERTAQISLESLLKLAFVLGAMEPFETLFPPEDRPNRLEDLFK